MRKIAVLLFAAIGAVHAAGTVFSTLLSGSGEDYATAVASDSQGNTYVAGLTYSPDFPVTPGAFQTTPGALGYPDAFVAKVGPAGNIIWATYLGGLIDDWATSVALDSSGNVWVAGQTRSANFPVTPNALQGTLDNSTNPDDDNFNTFVAELSPDGSKLLYSTFLGNGNANAAAGMVLDSGNNVYVAINANSTAGFQGIQNGSAGGIVVTKLNPKGALLYSYFHPSGLAQALTVDSTGAVYVAATTGEFVFFTETPIASQAVVFKISPDGSTKVYENSFGGSVSATATAIAVDGAGEAWVGGFTQSADFPLVHPLQSTFGARPIWESSNAGATWTPIDNLPFALPQAMAVDPTTPTTLYEATADRGVFKSTNGGSTWTQSSTGIGGTNAITVAIDPLHTQTLYAATATTVYKSTNGAASWSAIDTPPFAVGKIEIDGQNTNIVYEAGSSIRKSTDGGTTWTNVTFPASLQSVVLDPRVSGHLIASSQLVFCGAFCGNGQNPYLWTSTDGGNTWTMLTSPAAATAPGLLVDPSTNPSTVYDGLNSKSSDGGMTWTAIPTPPFDVSKVETFNVDPGGNLYVPVIAGPMYVSRDHGQSWVETGSPTPSWTTDQSGPGVAGIVAAGSAGTLYDTLTTPGTAGFVTKLSADGSTIEYSTYLDGHTALAPFFDYVAEPNAMLIENWINGIALDASGNVIVTGGTRAIDFPTVDAAQAANAGGSDAFAAILSADGSRLNYATYFGGSQDDGALAATIDSTGDIILAGQTFSNDFPVSGQFPAHTGIGDAFVTKLVTGPPAVSSVLSAASYRPGIESGSWAMIQGVNLSNSTRPWQGSDFSGDGLPTVLDGVGVTVDGQPAFLSYISPSQINIQVPSDSTLGAVNVVVTNNGAVSKPFSVTLQAVAPAFFMYLGTSDIVATTLNYALVGDPSVVSGAAPAHPGDLVVLWGTGFGATTPSVPSGTLVTGAPATSALPGVTVGGVSAQVISSVLTAGEAGLYQVSIRIPAGIPSGEEAVTASIGGVSGAPVTIFIAAP